MSEANYRRSAQVEIILYTFLVGFVVFFPLLVGLSLRGFEESFIKGQSLVFGSYLANFLTYLPFIFGSITLLLFPISELWFLGKSKKHPSVDSSGAWYTKLFTASFIHSPERNGLLWQLFRDSGKSEEKNPMRWTKNPLRLFLISILVFGIYGLLLIGNPQLAVSGVPQLQLQQVTLASEVTFSALVPGWGENASLLFFFMLLMGAVALILSRLKNKNIYAYYGAGFFVCILMGLLWMSYHLIAYSGSDAGLIGTFLFGFIGSLLTLLFASLIPFFVWHIMNNAFLTLRDLIIITEDLFLIAGLIWFFLLVGTIGVTIYKRYRKGKKRKLAVGIPS